MKEFRCHHCNALLYKAEGNIETEAICQRCRRVNYPSRKDQLLGLRGKDFQARSLNHNCYNCQRLLFRSIGEGKIETKCRYCATVNDFDTIDMRKSGYKSKSPETLKFKKIKESIAR